jgi:hypothetical protein
MRSRYSTHFDINGWTVESDGIFIGMEGGKQKRKGYENKLKVQSLVDRDTGCARSMVIYILKAKTIVPIFRKNIDRKAKIMTHDTCQYAPINEHLPEHQVVKHSKGSTSFPKTPPFKPTARKAFSQSSR